MKKTSSTFIRKFTAIVLTVYFGMSVLIVVITTLAGELARDNVGSTLLYIGVAIFILGFLFMGATNRGDGVAKSIRMRNDVQYKEWRRQERPVELVTWAIILAAAMMVITGYVILYLL